MSVNTSAMSNMPESIKEIADYVGEEGALTMLQAFPGIRLFIPKKVPDGHVLIEKIGKALAEKLSVHFGGETLTIPRGAKVLRMARNKEIIKKYDAKMTVRELVGEYKLTERQVYTILQETVT